ncbi:uncharacterized protein LOC131951599 [Physella acuta]|uniref:uncharacterized protein LOC131951599 n=1 Tax=Physella acuta TaxID=109671 RepID=UPI0027DAF12F|nr:uncharacterized protein LOC131951599 [Physella acuta]
MADKTAVTLLNQKEESEDNVESDEWKAQKYRNKVIERIQEEMRKSESQVPKSAAELEEFVFSKATSRKSYLDLVARILIYITEFNKKKEKKDEMAGDP